MSKLKPTYSFIKRLDFLSSGKLYLKDSVKTITLSYETRGSPSDGLRFVILMILILGTVNSTII